MTTTINASTTLGLISSADTSGVLQLQTANTAAVTIDASQNVGVGTASPTDTDGFGRVLDIRSASGGQVVIRDNDDTTKFARLAFDGGSTNAAYVGAEGSGTSVLFRAGAATRATLDSAGNLGLGVTPSAWGSSYKALEVGGVVSYFSSANQYFGMYANAYRNSGGSYIYTTTGVSSGYLQDLGAHKWFNAASGTAGNAISFTQSMTLNSSGQWLLNTTSPIYSNADAAHIYGKVSGSNQYGLMIGGDAASYTCYAARFLTNNSGNVVGSITFSTSSTLYNVTSDQRLKENIQDADNAASLIDALQVRKFDWKSDASHQRYGFVAQELVTVAPEAVHQPADPEEMMAVDYSKLVPMLVKEIQSLRQRLAVLEGK